MANIEVEVKDGVAEIKSGRQKGWMIAIDTAAKQFLEGHTPRSNIADALALSAGYLDARLQIRKLQRDVRRLEDIAVAFNEWIEKTNWVQEQIDSFFTNPLGMHRADIMREEIKQLRSIVRHDVPFNAQRLRNVAELVGLGSAVPADNITLDGARGAVLGQIAAKLRDGNRDADRWRAFVGSGRIKPQGSAGLGTPMANNYAHMGLEIWTTFDRDYSPELLKKLDADNELGRKWLTQYADIAIEALKAKPHGA